MNLNSKLFPCRIRNCEEEGTIQVTRAYPDGTLATFYLCLPHAEEMMHKARAEGYVLEEE